MRFLFIILLFLNNLFAEKPVLDVFFMNNCDAQLENCGCPSLPNGGMDRRFNFIKAYQKKYPDAILLDNGDNLGMIKDKIKDKYIFKALHLFPNTGLGIGERELHNGLDFFLKHKRKLPYVNLNLFYYKNNTKRHLGKPYIIYKHSQYKILITGIMPRSVYNQVLDKKIIFKDYQYLLKKLLRTVKPDYTILLSHGDIQKNKYIAGKIKGLDLIIGAHSEDVTDSPLKTRKTWIVQAGDHCQYVGHIRVDIKKNKILDYSIITLDDEYAQEKNSIHKLVEHLEKEYEQASDLLR